jgi:hypothetical protein
VVVKRERERHELAKERKWREKRVLVWFLFGVEMKSGQNNNDQHLILTTSYITRQEEKR